MNVLEQHLTIVREACDRSGEIGNTGESMSQRDKLLVKILLGTSDANL
jgi:hypothetical protein